MMLQWTPKANLFGLVVLLLSSSLFKISSVNGLDLGDVGEFLFGEEDTPTEEDVRTDIFKPKYSPLQEPFNQYLGSLKLKLPVQTVTSSGVDLSFGPITCNHAGYSGASITPDKKLTALNTDISGMSIACESPFQAKYKMLHTAGSLVIKSTSASLKTAVAPSNGSKPPKDGTLPTAMAMTACSVDAGDISLNFEGKGPLIAILNKLKKHLLSIVVSKGEAQACAVLEAAVNEQATSTLAFIESMLLN